MNSNPNTDPIKLWNDRQPPIIRHLWGELTYLRGRHLKKQKEEQQQQLDRPVTSYMKSDRLRNGIGTEIVVIFRSKACSWAHSDSGGCTMCGYFNDRAPPELTPDDLWAQFQFAIDKYRTVLLNSANLIIFKLFTSGSFPDPKEIPFDLQEKILKSLTEFPSIKEIVVESRPEYITETVVQQYHQILGNIYTEFGVGLESADNYIRTNIVNKGFQWAEFQRVLHLSHQYNFGIKAYLLLKPPFIGEYLSISDLFQSIKACVRAEVDTISINPTSIQQNTVCDELAKDNSYHPPWLFSLLWAIKHALTPEDLKKTRVLCDPLSLGRDRGVHNEPGDDPSNDLCIEILRKFVDTQELNAIPEFAQDPRFAHAWETFLRNCFFN